MSASVRLSDRQACVLLALLDIGAPAIGDALASQMRNNGRDTSVAGAHQGANGLVQKGLAAKRFDLGTYIRYELTDEGRAVAARMRGRS